jgi:hypothetical protein
VPNGVGAEEGRLCADGLRWAERAVDQGEGRSADGYAELEVAGAVRVWANAAVEQFVGKPAPDGRARSGG